MKIRDQQRCVVRRAGVWLYPQGAPRAYRVCSVLCEPERAGQLVSVERSRTECAVGVRGVKIIATREGDDEAEGESYPVLVVQDRVWCAALARRFARDAGLDGCASLAVGLATAELASNAVRHGGGGLVRLRVVRLPRAAIELLVSDDGPGIADVGLALVDGISRGARLLPDGPRDGLGAGLGAVARLMDALTIETAPRRGTKVTALKWLACHARH